MSPTRGVVRFFFGPMSAGKSTVALQTLHNLTSVGLAGLLLSCQDRGGGGTVTSRTGMRSDAVEVEPGTDVFTLLGTSGPAGGPVRFVVADEAQFLTAEQVSEAARAADELGVDVYAFGLSTDFAARLFPGAARLIALADELVRLPLATPCWCGAPGQQNARVVDGVVTHTGEQVLVGDVTSDAPVYYRVLCRAHWRTGELR